MPDIVGRIVSQFLCQFLPPNRRFQQLRSRHRCSVSPMKLGKLRLSSEAGNGPLDQESSGSLPGGAMRSPASSSILPGFFVFPCGGSVSCSVPTAIAGRSHHRFVSLVTRARRRRRDDLSTAARCRYPTIRRRRQRPRHDRLTRSDLRSAGRPAGRPIAPGTGSTPVAHAPTTSLAAAAWRILAPPSHVASESPNAPATAGKGGCFEDHAPKSDTAEV
jgi:hypothetical protein